MGFQPDRMFGASWASRSVNGLGLIWLRSSVDEGSMGLEGTSTCGSGVDPGSFWA